jgi:hypothetical protein
LQISANAWLSVESLDATPQPKCRGNRLISDISVQGQASYVLASTLATLSAKATTSSVTACAQQSGGSIRVKSYRDATHVGNDMHKLHSIAALRGDGLQPELRLLFERLAIDPHSGLHIRHDGMLQAGPDPASEAPDVVRAKPKRVA